MKNEVCMAKRLKQINNCHEIESNVLHISNSGNISTIHGMVIITRFIALQWWI